MMCFRDRTFCSGDGCGRFDICPWALTAEVVAAAARAGLMISQHAEPKALSCWASKAQVEGGAA